MKHRAWLVVLLLVLTLGCLSAARAESVRYDANTLAIVNNPNPSDRLNLRMGPSSTAESRGKYYTGVHVELVERLGNGWVYVFVGGDGLGSSEGYMDERFLCFDPTSQSVPSMSPMMRVAVAGGQPLQAKPSANAETRTFLPYGTPVIVLGYTADGYLHVQAAGAAGFLPESALVDDSMNATGGSENQYSGGDHDPNALYSDTTVIQMDIGWTETGTLREVAPGQYEASVQLDFHGLIANDVVIAYTLYVNGESTSVAQLFQPGYTPEQVAAPTYFTASFSYSGTIQSAELRPIYQKTRLETTNTMDYIHFTAN